MTNTNNASGAGMEKLSDDAVQWEISAASTNPAWLDMEYGRRIEELVRTDALRLLAEKEGELQRLREANAALLDQMHHFANADQRLWDEGQRDAEAFKSWVRSRVAHLLAKFNTKEAP